MGGTNPILTALQQLGLAGCKSEQKRIPQIYLLNDVATRRALLQGLMDTDGSITTFGAMEFSSSSGGLARDVQMLVHSLGGKASIENRQTHYTHKGERRAGLPSYRVRIRLNECPFRLTRKAARWWKRRNRSDRIIHQITEIEPDYATCIEVDHPSHTYVIEHGIVTHNTEGAGGYEVTLHLTGRYPDWWPGLRFDRPVDVWVCGKFNEPTRDILQKKLLGPVTWISRKKTVRGTGLIPGEDIVDGSISWKRGIADFIDTIKIRHRTGGFSELGFKSYQQGRGSFEGTERDIIWDDEEPPLAIYIEQRIRLMTRNGHLLSTFTPNEGMSEVVREFVTPRILDALIERWRQMGGGE
jgi:phage terminase large subunit-like protein